ncbi:hypothetical protein B0H13DRAFT_929799 [Mycena leptocephala]|nr:hypothetical protein B0H13DRAFT_929799 [Mycena leptocephala]
MPKRSEYYPLSPNDPADDVEGLPLPEKFTWPFSFSRTLLVVIIATETLALAIAIVLLFARAPATTCTLPPHSQRVLYSPAHEAVEHEVQVYNLGFPGDLSPFQIPSSPALDEMWSNLYNRGISRITKEEAARLPNKTHPIPGDDDHYIVGLGVFHDLHCLNKIRMALDPEYYPDARVSTTNNWIPAQEEATEHVSHCMDWLRRSIMCNGDTSLIVWQWQELKNRTMPQATVAHTCRKFDKLLDWANAHEMKVDYDPTIHIEDDIIVPIFHNEIP